MTWFLSVEPAGVSTTVLTRRSLGCGRRSMSVSLVEAVDEPGRVGRVAHERLGDLTHREGALGIEDEERLEVAGREAELLRDAHRRALVGEEVAHQRLPDLAGELVLGDACHVRTLPVGVPPRVEAIDI